METEMLELGGFFTSTSFLSQLAGFLTAIFSAFFGDLLAGLFGG
jgi:hypothetical protein